MILLIGCLTAVILVFFGWLVKYKKAYWLIAGYNTMSAKRQENVDTKGLGNLMGNLCFCFAALSLAGAVLLELGQGTLATISFVLFLPVLTFGLIRAQKFDGNLRDAHGKMTAKGKRSVGAIVLVIMLIAGGVGAMFYYSSRPAGYNIENGVLDISGMYGLEVRMFEITDIRLLDEMPGITYRNNGSSFGNMMKGNFTVEGIGSAKLFVDVSKPPFIYLESETMSILLNEPDEVKTRSLYWELIAEWTGGC